jgi:pyoverdine/dityrosine biosynthesis protein Dit1
MDGLDYRLLNGATGKHLSKESVKKVAGDMAKKAMFYSDALRTLASETFPNGIRLSCHEYPPHQSSKIGFHLVEAHDAWLTPWHGVMVYVVSEDRWILMKNYQAQAIGSRLVEVNGKANHYEIDHWKAPPDWPNE